MTHVLLPPEGDDVDGPQCRECFKPLPSAEPDGLCKACRDYARHEEGDQLTKRLSVSELVPVWQQAERDIRAAFAIIARAERELNAAFTLDATCGLQVRARRNCQVDFNDPDEPLLELRRGIWSCLIDRLELRRMMSMAAWKELDKQLDGKDIPEITEATVQAMVEQYSSQLPAMLEAAVVEVFEWLRPPRSRFKTNTELEIGKRVCLEGVIDTFGLSFGDRRLKIQYHYEQHFIALENVLYALDGRGQISKTHYSALADAIRNAGYPCSGETEYFKFRGFKNRALHLEFKRLDLLDKFNRIAGGARLRPKKEPK